MGTTLLFANKKSERLEDRELDGQVLLRVLAEVVDQLDGLGGELVDVVVELVVVEEFSGGALAALDAGDDVIDALGGGVEARDCGAGVVVECLVGEEFAGGSATGADVGGDGVDVVGGAVQAREGGARLVVDGVVVQEFARRAATAVQVFGDLVEACGDGGDVVVDRRIVDEFRRRALTGTDFADDGLRLAHREIQVVVERLVVDEATERALTLVDLRGDAGHLLGEAVELIDELVAGGGELRHAALGRRAQLGLVGDGLAEGSPRRDADDLVAPQETGRGELRLGVAADEVCDGLAVNHAIDGEQRLDPRVFRVVGGGQQVHVIDAPDPHAREAHLAPFAQALGGRELHPQVLLRLERDVARSVQDQNDQHDDGDHDEDADAHLAQSDGFSGWRHC